VKHVFVKAAARLNNRTENSHQPTRERERRIQLAARFVAWREFAELAQNPSTAF
jgi:putative transposase